jgi:hypothetical protein
MDMSIDSDNCYSPEQLEALKKLISTAGLIRVFDGAKWVDLRRVMAEIIEVLAFNVKEFGKLEVQLRRVETHNENLQAEVARLSNPAYHD